MVGANNGGYIEASYSTGAVSTISWSRKGGLVGPDFRKRISDSYWNTDTSGQTTSNGGKGKTTAELQTPTGYTGIYANWNLDLDNADGIATWEEFGSQRPTGLILFEGESVTREVFRDLTPRVCGGRAFAGAQLAPVLPVLFQRRHQRRRRRLSRSEFQLPVICKSRADVGPSELRPGRGCWDFFQQCCGCR